MGEGCVAGGQDYYSVAHLTAAAAAALSVCLDTCVYSSCLVPTPRDAFVACGMWQAAAATATATTAFNQRQQQQQQQTPRSPLGHQRLLLVHDFGQNSPRRCCRCAPACAAAASDSSAAPCLLCCCCLQCCRLICCCCCCLAFFVPTAHS